MKIDPTTAANICTVAAAKFRENAEIFRRLINTIPVEGSMLPSGEAARRVAELFEHQAEEAATYAEAFMNVPEPIELEAYSYESP